MVFDILRQLICHSGLLQTDRTLRRVEVLHVGWLHFLLVLLENAGQGVVLLQEVFLAVREFSPFQVIHDIEVLSRVVVQVHIIDYVVIRLYMVDDIAPVVVVGEDILGRVDEDFLLVANLDLEGNQCHVQFVVEDHADLFKFQANELVAFKRNTIELILDTC